MRQMTGIQEMFDLMREKLQERLAQLDQIQAQWQAHLQNQEISEDYSRDLQDNLMVMYYQYIDSPYVIEHLVEQMNDYNQWMWLPTLQEFDDHMSGRAIDWEHSKRFASQGVPPGVIHVTL